MAIDWWCHSTISSFIEPFSSHLQSFPESGSFQISQFFALDGQSTGVSASASSPSNEDSGLISLRMAWLDVLAVQGTLKSLLQHHSSKSSILWQSAFFTVQSSHPYMTTEKKNHSFSRWTQGSHSMQTPWAVTQSDFCAMGLVREFLTTSSSNCFYLSFSDQHHVNCNHLNDVLNFFTIKEENEVRLWEASHQ